MASILACYGVGALALRAVKHVLSTKRQRSLESEVEALRNENAALRLKVDATVPPCGEADDDEPLAKRQRVEPCVDNSLDHCPVFNSLTLANDQLQAPQLLISSFQTSHQTADGKTLALPTLLLDIDKSAQVGVTAQQELNDAMADEETPEASPEQALEAAGGGSQPLLDVPEQGVIEAPAPAPATTQPLPENRYEWPPAEGRMEFSDLLAQARARSAVEVAQQPLGGVCQASQPAADLSLRPCSAALQDDGSKEARARRAASQDTQESPAALAQSMRRQVERLFFQPTGGSAPVLVDSETGSEPPSPCSSESNDPSPADSLLTSPPRADSSFLPPWLASPGLREDRQISSSDNDSPERGTERLDGSVHTWSVHQPTPSLSAQPHSVHSSQGAESDEDESSEPLRAPVDTAHLAPWLLAVPDSEAAAKSQVSVSEAEDEEDKDEGQEESEEEKDTGIE